MRVQEYKQRFFDILSKIYDESEVDSFFMILIEAYTAMTRVDLVLNPDKELTKLQKQQLDNAQERLEAQQPIQYILGETYFYGLKFKVNPNVLIPRPETEELVDWIIKDCKESLKNDQIRILDIGTGSGCIAISLAKNIANAKVSALDVSDKALEVAKENALCHQADVEFIQADILQLESLADHFDIIVSNPPYVRNLEKIEMKPNVLQNEPHLALFVANDDPLIFYRKIAELSKMHMTEKGSLYFEINQYLVKEMKETIRDIGFDTMDLRKDISGNYRMLKIINT